VFDTDTVHRPVVEVNYRKGLAPTTCPGCGQGTLDILQCDGEEGRGILCKCAACGYYNEQQIRAEDLGAKIST